MSLATRSSRSPLFAGSFKSSQSLKTSKKRRRWYRRILSIGIGASLLGAIVSWWVAGALVAPAPAELGTPPADLPANLSAVAFKISSDSGSEIAGWKLTAKPSRGVMVLLHGIRGNRRAMLPRARMLGELGYSTILIDLQSHGESTGDRIMLGHQEKHDVRAGVEYARQQFPGQRVGVIGVSLGGASALLASPMDIDALVIESVYPTIEKAIENRVRAAIGPLAPIPAKILLIQLKPRLGVEPNQLRPIDGMAKVECPVFVLSGQEDTHTTADETIQMFELASSPRQHWLVPGAGHVDLMEFDPTEYRFRVGHFIDQYIGNHVSDHDPTDRHESINL